MPRLRQPPTVAKKEELFDSEAIAKPVEEQPPEPKIVKAVEGGWEPEGAEPQRLEQLVVEKPVVVEPESKQDDAAIALKRQVEAHKQSEEALKQAIQQREQSIRDQQNKILKSQREVVDAQEIALQNSMKEAEATAEKAVQDIKTAGELGDFAAQAEAHRRLAKAESRLASYEAGIEQLKEHKRQLKKERRKMEEAQSQPQLQQQQQQQQFNLPHVVEFRREYPDLFNDTERNLELNGAFAKSKREGYEPYSQAQIERIKEILELAPSKQPVQQQPERRTNIVSAPVSREVPSSGSGQRQGGRITLTPEELEAARISQVTPQEYARQKQKMLEAKANGQYGGGP